MTSIRDMAVVFGIIASIIGAAIAYGSNIKEIKDTKESLFEFKTDVKKELKENRDINLQQTVLLKETSIRLEGLTDAIKDLKKD